MGKRTLLDPSKMTKKQIYNDIRYKMARQKCLELAGYRCQECARYGRETLATTAHHIQHIEDHPELAFSVSNLRAICAECHNKEHPEKGGNRGWRSRAADRDEY